MTSILLSKTGHELNCCLIFNPVLAEFWSVQYHTCRRALEDCSDQESLTVVAGTRPLSFRSKHSPGFSQPHLITNRCKGKKRDIHRKRKEKKREKKRKEKRERY